MITLLINGQTHELDVDPNTPLLWVIREQAGLTGTKFGCGIAQCGACTLHPVQQAWIDEQVPQCGYCQSGQIMSAVALLEDNPAPSDDEIDTAMSGNICRCGTYSRIRRGIKRAATTLASTSGTEGSHHG
jgi:isoquinoline 1-oxidoreductase alpha subunit